MHGSKHLFKLVCFSFSLARPIFALFFSYYGVLNVKRLLLNSANSKLSHSSASSLHICQINKNYKQWNVRECIKVNSTQTEERLQTGSERSISGKTGYLPAQHFDGFLTSGKRHTADMKQLLAILYFTLYSIIYGVLLKDILIRVCLSIGS